MPRSHAGTRRNTEVIGRTSRQSMTLGVGPKKTLNNAALGCRKNGIRRTRRGNSPGSAFIGIDTPHSRSSFPEPWPERGARPKNPRKNFPVNAAGNSNSRRTASASSAEIRETFTRSTATSATRKFAKVNRGKPDRVAGHRIPFDPKSKTCS